MRYLKLILVSGMVTFVGACGSSDSSIEEENGIIYSSGEESAEIVIREYSDFACAECSSHFLENTEDIQALAKEQGWKYEFVPVASSESEHSLFAAKAAECVTKQQPYTRAQRALFYTQQHWRDNPNAQGVIKNSLQILVPDQEAFEACLQGGSATVESRVQAGTRRVEKIDRELPIVVVRKGGEERVLDGMTTSQEVKAAVEDLD